MDRRLDVVFIFPLILQRVLGNQRLKWMAIAWSYNLGLSHKAWNAQQGTIIGSLMNQKILDHMELYYLQKHNMIILCH